MRSAPGTTGISAPQPTYPAVYEVSLEPWSHIAAVRPLFYGESSATIVNVGDFGASTLALTDPDSNEDVPWFAPRFAGEFMLTSQGDQQQIYVAGAGTINKITGPFEPGTVLVADTPCGANSAPATCPGHPANYLGELNPWTGEITAVNLSGPAVEPQGMLFLP